MFIKSIMGAVAAAILISSFSAHAALVGRDLDGNPATAEAYYSTNQGISWVANANINGAASWDSQIAWAAGLVIGSATNWRLPTSDVNGDNDIIVCFPGGVTGCIDNEMGYLYWEEGITASTPGPFDNVQSPFYWSSTEFGEFSAYYTNFNLGGTSITGKSTELFAWAVHDGMVGDAVIPVPAAAWLFGSGLIWLAAVARRKST